MSIRAYKVIEIKTEKVSTFNLSHNYDILSQIDGFTESLSDECTGLVSIQKDALEDVIAETMIALDATKDKQELIALNEQLDVLNNILSDMGDDDYVDYLCS